MKIDVVFTVVTGRYDTPRPPKERIEGCKYICFSDEPHEFEGWDNVVVENKRGIPPHEFSRYLKIGNPFFTYAKGETWVYVDANYQIVGDLQKLRFGVFFAVKHPERTNAYEEINYLIDHAEHYKINPKDLARLTDQYTKIKYKSTKGILAGGFFGIYFNQAGYNFKIGRAHV